MIYIVVGIADPVVLMLALRDPRWVGGISLIVALLASTFAASAAYTMWQDFAADAPGPALPGLERVSEAVAEDLFDIGRRVPVPLLARILQPGLDGRVREDACALVLRADGVLCVGD